MTRNAIDPRPKTHLSTLQLTSHENMAIPTPPRRHVFVRRPFSSALLRSSLVHPIRRHGCTLCLACALPTLVTIGDGPPFVVRRRVLDVFRHGKLLNISTARSRGDSTHVMIVLLHRHHPRHIVEGHGSQSEICVVLNLANLPHEGI